MTKEIHTGKKKSECTAKITNLLKMQQKKKNPKHIQNRGKTCKKTMGNTHLHGFRSLSRIRNILAPGTNREENVSQRQRLSQAQIKWQKIIVLHPFSIHTPF